MHRLLVLAPALAVVAAGVIALAVYTVRVLAGRPPVIASLKTNDVLGVFWSRYAYWCAAPFERALVASRITPNGVTALSLAACIGAGVAIGFGQLAIGAWLYGVGGMLDLLDGRLARALGRQTSSGALFDSVADRWAELALFAGYAWFLRDTPWLLAALGASAGSMMVSYTRARSEGLGLTLRAGAMQRAERILLVTFGTLAAAVFAASASTASWVVPTAGGALTACAVLSTATALRRWVDGHRALTAREPRS